MKPSIAVVGSSNTDMVIQVERVPRPGETLLGGKFVQAAGGKGANQAVAAARAGGDVCFVARVGADPLGDEAVRGFRREGIRAHHVSRDSKVPSGVALIFVGLDGENSIAVASGANGRLSPAEIGRARGAITSADIVVLQLETPLGAVERAARLASEAGVTVILNPAPARKLPRSLLRHVTLLTPNESEAETLTGVRVKDPGTRQEAADRLHEAGVPKVVMTLGAAGAYVSAPEFTGLVRGLKVRAVDTTAAGDVFNGALAVALGERKSIENAVRFANAAAAISVTRMGAQPSAPKRREIECLLAKKLSKYG